MRLRFRGRDLFLPQGLRLRRVRLYGDARLRAAAGPGMPDPYCVTIQKAAAMRFLHSCGFIYTLLCAHISGVTGTAP